VVTLLDDAAAERIRQAIESAERATAGELRVVLVRRAARPDLLAGALVALAASVPAFAIAARRAWGVLLVQDLLWAGGAALALGALAAWLLPRFMTERSVARCAAEEFERLGIERTSARTGVLLLLAEAERRAVLLADRSIDERVPPGTWDGIVGALVGDLRAGRAADGVPRAVEEIGRRLAEHFPRQEGDVNELPDTLERR
jgi:putative membrane protein